MPPLSNGTAAAPLTRSDAGIIRMKLDLQATADRKAKKATSVNDEPQSSC